MATAVETPTAQAVVEALKQQLPPVEWEKLPHLIEQANKRGEENHPQTDEDSDLYAASYRAATRFFEDEEG